MAEPRKADGEINWEDIYVRLYAYVHALLSVVHGFRGPRSDSLVKGKQVHDYVSGAIEEFLSHPEKYDPTKRSLVNYLKLHVIRSSISNDLRSAENRSTSDVFAPNIKEVHGDDHLDLILPFVDAYLDHQIDYDLIVGHIERSVKGDREAESILAGILSGLKRREIIQNSKLTEKEYDNGMRRLTTVLKNTAKYFQLTPNSI